MTDYEIPSDSGSSVKEIMIDPSEWDPTRVVIHDPVTSSFKIGASDISVTKSSAFYLDDEGNECKLYFPAPPQMCFGPQYQYELGVSEEQKDPSKAKGVQVGYPMTSLQSMNAPTPAEQAFQDMIQGIWDISLAKGISEMEKGVAPDDGADDVEPGTYTSLPSVAYSSFFLASSNKKWTNALKPAFEHPRDQKSQNKKGYDTTKPKRMYLKLKTTGKGEKMRVLTPFYGPGDKKESPLKYLEQRGVITPCIEWDGIFFGGHGTQPHGASLRLYIVEANFVPSSSSDGGLPKNRMLPKNTALPSEDVEVKEEDDQSDEDTFAAPSSKTFSKPSTAPKSKATLPAPKSKAKATSGHTTAPKTKAATPAPKAKATAPPKTKAATKAKATAPPKTKAAPPAPKTKAKIAPAPLRPKPKPVEEEEVEAEEEEVEADAEEDVEEEAED